MDKIVLIGGGGHAASVLDTLLSGGRYDVVGIIDQKAEVTKAMLGIPFLGNDENLPILLKKGIKNAAISVGSVGDTSIRHRIYNMVKALGFKLPAIIDSSAVIGRCTIGEGVFIGKKAVVNALTNIDKMSIINTGAVIEHGCNIGEFCHIAPGAILGGGVTVGEHTHVGIGTVVIQGIHVGRTSLIGAGSVVVNDIRDGIKAYGNPCREVENI